MGKTIKFEITDEEYAQQLALKDGKTHREAYLEGLGITPERRVIGRPTADSLRGYLAQDREYQGAKAAVDVLKQSLDSQAFQRANDEGLSRLRAENAAMHKRARLNGLPPRSGE